MKLEALNRVQGVKVLAGKGKGDKTAFVGDIFEAKDTSEGERLVAIGAAKKYVVEDKLAGSEEKPEKKAAGKAPAKKAAGQKSGDQKAEDGSDTADDSDLGLGG